MIADEAIAVGEAVLSVKRALHEAKINRPRKNGGAGAGRPARLVTTQPKSLDSRTIVEYR